MSRSTTWYTPKSRLSESARFCQNDPVPVNAPTNDALFCREQALSANPLLRISLLFVERPLAERLLALHALFASIELAGSAVSESEVALRKLAWWKEEIERFGRSESRHPVMRELHRCGAAQFLRAECLQTLLDDAWARVDAVAPANLDELAFICRKMGGPQVEMERAVCGDSTAGAHSLGELMTRRGVMQLARELHRKPASENFWWCPLDILARYGLKRTELMQPIDDHLGRKVSNDILCAEVVGKSSSIDILRNIPIKKHKHINLYVLDMLIWRKLENMKISSPVSYGGILEKTGFGDLLAGWKAARQLNRLK